MLRRTWILVTLPALILGTQVNPTWGGDPPPLARFFPRDHLVFYFEHDGTSRHAEAWGRTAAARILAEGRTAEMLRSLLHQVVDLNRGDRAKRGEVLLPALDHLFREGFAVGLVQPPNAARPSLYGIVVRGAGTREGRAAFDEFLIRIVGVALNPPVESIRGRDVEVQALHAHRELAWWSEGDDLLISVLGRAGVEPMVQAAEGKTPSAVELPLRSELQRAIGTYVPVARGFVDLESLGDGATEVARRLGLEGVRRIDLRWGFDGPALRTIARIQAPDPRRGLLTLLDQPGFLAKEVAADAPLSLTLSLDLAKTLDTIAALQARPGVITSPSARLLDDVIANTRENAGLDLKEDLLRPLGSTHTFRFHGGGPGSAPTSPLVGFLQGMLHPPRATWSIPARDAASYAPKLSRFLVELAKDFEAAPRQGPSPSEAGSKGPQLVSRQGPGASPGWTFRHSIPAFPLFVGLRPAINLGPDRLVLGTTPRAADADTLPTESAGLPPELLASLPERLIVLAVSDESRSLWPDLLAALPEIVDLFGTNDGMVPPLRAILSNLGARTGGIELPLYVEPALAPRAEDIRKHLVPSVLALSVNDAGITLDARSPLPSLVPIPLAMLLFGTSGLDLRPTPAAATEAHQPIQEDRARLP